MAVKVSDYIAHILVKNRIEHVFTITGGAAMHLNDSLGKHPELQCIYNHHEQACAMAAESYARLTGKIAAVCVTSGPGGTNAITGVLGGWLDSIPMLIISGQVRFDTTVRSTGMNMRQLGYQEFDITKAVSGMTKYAVMVTNPLGIRYHLERAIYLAKAGRPGPCWLDIPLNVQGSMIEVNDLRSYDPSEDLQEMPPSVPSDIVLEVIERINFSKRPVLLAGSAIRISGAHEEFLKLIDLLNIPVVTAWNSHDSLYDDHRLYFGRPGTVGDRAGNFIVQNSDLLLVLGCRLNIRQISYNWKVFAREAYKIIIDIDPLELKKPTVSPDLPVNCNVADFIRALLDKIPSEGIPHKTEWLEWCKLRKNKYPVVLNEYWELDKFINPYCFVQSLTRQIPEGQVIVTGNGSACVCTFQAAYIKKGQRLYTNSGCASMGYDIPAAIGACIGADKKKIVCIAGDGSIQMNLQELQTIIHYKLPVKIFVLNNNGYHSIRQTQGNFFGKPLIGCEPQSGVSFPDMQKIACAYGFSFIRCTWHAELDDCITKTLEGDDPYICEVMLTAEQPFTPRVSSKRLPDGRIVSAPLEDMYPFIDREEFRENMIIKILDE